MNSETKATPAEYSKPAPLEFLTIQLAAEKAMPSIAGVTFVHGQGRIYFDARDKAAATAAKRAVGAFLKANFPHRTYYHAKSRSYGVWHLRDYSGYATGEVRCGIRIALTEEERASICLGPLSGVNCVGRAA